MSRYNQKTNISIYVSIFSFSAIITAAMEMLGGGGGVSAQCRTPEIMADAAYVMLTRDSKSFTGNFAIGFQPFQ